MSSLLISQTLPSPLSAESLLGNAPPPGKKTNDNSVVPVFPKQGAKELSLEPFKKKTIEVVFDSPTRKQTPNNSFPAFYPGSISTGVDAVACIFEKDAYQVEIINKTPNNFLLLSTKPIGKVINL